MKRHYHLLGGLLTLAIGAAFMVYVAHALHGHDLRVYATPRALIGIGLATLAYGMGIPLLALAWREMLRGLDIHKPWRELTAILGITQIAKYVPGNVGQYVGRAAMSLSRGIPARAFAVTLILETLLVVAAALTVGVGAGVLSDIGLNVVRDRTLQLIVIAILLVLVAGGLMAFRLLAPRLLRHFAPQHAHLLQGQLLPDRSRIVIAFGLYCAANLCIGLGLVLLARCLQIGSPQAIWLLIACFALAWVVGFVTPGAPAGLGVREGLLLLMLGPVFTPALAGVLIIALRIATTLGDVLWLLVGALLLPKPQSAVSVRSIP